MQLQKTGAPQRTRKHGAHPPSHPPSGRVSQWESQTVCSRCIRRGGPLLLHEGAPAAGASRPRPRLEGDVTSSLRLLVPQVKPLGERVFVKVAPAEEQTQGGILLPGDAQQKPTSGDVVSIGEKAKELKEGMTVLYSKFGIGSTDLEFKEEDHILLRESDILGTFPRANATADDVKDLQPLGDRVLLRVQEAEGATEGGLVLPDSAKEAPVVGTVVRVGRGKEDSDGKVKEPQLQENDRVIYFKYAGDKLSDSSGTEYIVIRESDILGKAN